MARRLRIRSLWLVLATVLAISAQGHDQAHAQGRIAGVELDRDSDGWLRCNVSAAELLDAKTLSTIESGLPSACLYEFRLRVDGGKQLLRMPLELSLRLEIWEDRYVVEGPGGSRSFASIDAADSAWAHPTGVRLLPTAQLPPGLALRLDVAVRVSPLGAAEKAWITDYVSQASRGQRNEFSLDLGGLLGRIFKGEAGSAVVGTGWSSPPFHVEELEVSP